jgi:hypothetical protein
MPPNDNLAVRTGEFSPSWWLQTSIGHVGAKYRIGFLKGVLIEVSRAVFRLMVRFTAYADLYRVNLLSDLGTDDVV